MTMSDPLAPIAPTPTYRGTNSRVGDSCKVIVLGGLLFALSLVVLVWSESQAVSVRRSFHRGAQTVVEATAESVSSDNTRKLVHIVGEAATTSSVSDSTFGIRSSNTNVLKLRRYAEMYQWVEEENTSKGSAQYVYEKEWESLLVDSEEFDEDATHVNPDYMAYKSQVFEADPITVGAFTLSEDVLKQMNWYIKLSDSITLEDIVDENIRSKAHIVDNTIYLSSNENGGDPSQNPSVGDSRITYEAVPPQTISVIAQQVGDTLVPYQRTAGGKTIVLVQAGTHSASDMFRDATASATSHVGMVRFSCFLLMYIGLLVLAKPLSILEDAIPVVGTLTGTNGKLSTSAVMMLPVAAVLSTTVIALSWLFYAPLLAVPFLALVGAGVYFAGRNLGYWGIDPATANYLDEFMELRQTF